MDMASLQSHRPISFRAAFQERNNTYKLKPFLGSVLGRITHFNQLTLWPKLQSSCGVSRRIIVNTSDFSRRRQRSASTSKSSGSYSKGFVPKAPSAGTNTQKRDRRIGGDDKNELEIPKASEVSGSEKTSTETEVDLEQQRVVDVSQDERLEEEESNRKSNVVEESSLVSVVSDGAPIEQGLDNGSIIRVSEEDKIGERNENVNDKTTPITTGNKASVYTIFGFVEKGKTDKVEDKEGTIKIKLEMEALKRFEEIERLAEERFSVGDKMFVFPPVVKPDTDVEVFLNKSLSVLENEAGVLVMGGFNDWRWKSFTTRLTRARLKGDWWSCRVHIPKEAYKMDFVFFNGQSVYDNNDERDFCVPIEGGMDVFAFEDFLLEEKHREMEKLAEEEAERERKAEEERRREAEKEAMQADRAQARKEIEQRREGLRHLLDKAAATLENVWFIKPSVFGGNDLVKVYYNRNSGPLAWAEEIWIHGGHNNWSVGPAIVERLVKSEEKDGGDWRFAKVVVPNKAFLLDWVFADGPPQIAKVYDNNRNQDFHAIVPKGIPAESYWVEQEEQLYTKLREERRVRDEAKRIKAEKTARLKAELKERTLKRFLLSQKHIVYTNPLEVQAGTFVAVYYNPSNTNLNGKSEVWFRGSFNRWTHRMGPLQPQKMLPVNSGSHVKCNVKVPLDAYMMDFVFSEREDGGIFDNKFGMDYHIPVSGGIAKEPPMHIVHISVEMAPIAKVGGLGDVVTSLSRAVQELNHHVDIVLPKYDCMNLGNVKDFGYNRSFSWDGTEIKVFTGKVEGISVYFLDPQNGLFRKGCVYGCNNDAERFGFFSHAALEFLLQTGLHPDIIHCHDWSSAPVSWIFKDQYKQYGLSKTRIVFTIHNLEFGARLIGKAMEYADKATTVSPTYSREVSGNPVIAPYLPKFHGIINGIDLDIWDPYNDKFIPVHYTSENVVEGKKAAKKALQERLNLARSDLPLIGIISRLTHQKGIHLIKHAISRTLDRGGQVVLLGSAPDPRIQDEFVKLANHLHSTRGDRACLCLTYDEPLSHLIYAGADFILVPSIFEPCGLTQLTAMRYGSIPIVRKTGGLFDTVFDVDHDKERANAQGLEPNGFNFDGADEAGVNYALNRAISAWYEGREWFNSLCKTVMEQDWSWNRPALDYMELYHSARKIA